MSFSKEWLSLRRDFDNRARNKCIEKCVAQYFTHPIHIMDIGTGTGNNVVYYQEKFEDSSWTLVDSDADLLDVCRKNLRQNIREMQHGSILDLDNFQGVDLITANAIFDLFSPEQFVSFAQKIHAYGVSLLATLNYKSMYFTPQAPQDKVYIEMYNQHMTRKQNFGCAMGERCTQKITDVLLDKLCYNVHMGKSDWIIDSSSPKMVKHILQFMFNALSEMTSDTTTLQNWVEDKQKMFQQKSVQLCISHSDIFAHP
ncbi:class I SAM-dependent methyltransferase [Candidatus Uabimicrobium amorphum]|uniref:Trans-aconitate methyltransferase n=1 Tax=Uabimicrobium amorphum TaxID=2596890 RepID=A0A5S9F2U2_UABAM|nr:class I SAM-dependent methyltransferase [Candidatus Uabimicrobium amorphum]BBM84035.1 trans-aconitate methyltransferase [Candidatus Uabimicrobium amorphum]